MDYGLGGDVDAGRYVPLLENAAGYQTRRTVADRDVVDFRDWQQHVRRACDESLVGVVYIHELIGIFDHVDAELCCHFDGSGLADPV